MNNRFNLRKEFFGGILYDKVTKKNIAIDSEIYSFLEAILNSNVSSIDIDDKSIIESISQLFSIGVIKPNIDFVCQYKEENKDHLTAPFRIFYDITYACNLRCKHCFTDSGIQRSNELSFDEKMHLIEEVKKLGTNRISIAGGEPLVCQDLMPFLKCCNENNIDVSLTTNGTLLTIDKILELNEINLKNLTISFDGGKKESFDYIRGGGTYDLVIAGLRLLNTYYKNVYSIKTTLMKNNINEIESIIETAINYGCKTVKFNCVRADGRAIQNNKSIILNKQEYVNVIKHIEDVKSKYNGQIQIKAPLNIFCKEDYDYIDELGFGCFAGKESICINPVGEVKPCSHFPKEFICGNIRETSLLDIWNNSEVLQHFRHLNGNDTCNECTQYDKCRAGCRFRAFCDGDINGIDPYCYMGV